METGLAIFSSDEFGQIRGLLRDGEPWFVANDVARALGYSVPKDAVATHCKYAELFKGGDLPPLSNSPYGMKIIPESDMYRLIMRSRLPSAERFEVWVMEDVLPSIRKTGSYGQSSQRVFTPTYTEQLAVLRMMLEAAQLSPDAIALGMNSANRALTGLDMLKASDVHLVPTVQDVALTPTQIAEIVQRGMTARKINKLLARKGFQEKQAGLWVVLAPGVPYARHEPVNKAHSNGTPVIQLKWFRTIVPLIEAWLD